MAGVNGNGYITYKIAYTGLKREPNPANIQWPEIQDLTLSMVTNNRGQVVAAEIEGPEPPRWSLAATVDTWLRIMRLALVPLPEEAVGIGARWSVTHMPFKGTLVNTVYELVEQRGNRSVVKVSMDITSKPMVFSDRGVLESSAEYQTAGSGSWNLDSAYAIPLDGAVILPLIGISFESSNSDERLIIRSDLNLELNQR